MSNMKKAPKLFIEELERREAPSPMIVVGDNPGADNASPNGILNANPNAGLGQVWFTTQMCGEEGNYC